VPLVLVVVLAWGRAGEARSRRWLRLAAGLALAGLVALALISAAYAFRRFGMPLSDLRWKSDLMLRLSRAFPDFALPVPADFLTGLDLVLDTERGKPINVVILGARHPDGVWHYFLVLWLLKTPVLVLVAVAFGLVRSVRLGLWRESPLVRVLGLGLLLHLAYFSLFFRYQTGYRFALMCVPLACLVAAAGLRPLLETGRGARWTAALLVVTWRSTRAISKPLACPRPGGPSARSSGSSRTPTWTGDRTTRRSTAGCATRGSWPRT
jgi:hypothetical protein